MKKPLVVYCRPLYWLSKPAQVENCQYHYVDLFGLDPLLRGGQRAHDSVGAVMDPKILGWAVDYCRRQKPQAFLFPPMYALDETKLQVDGVVQFLDRLKTASPNTKFIYWNGNQQGYIDYNLAAYKPFVDVIFTNTDETKERELFQSAGIKDVRTFYQFGFDPAEHGRALKGKLRECHFAGSQTFLKNRPIKYPYSEWRFKFFCRVSKRFDLALYGKGQWPFTTINYQYGQAFYDSFVHCKVILGSNHWDYLRYYTRRTVYALASGRPYVVRYIPGMEQDFENGKHLVWFKEIDEGLEEIHRLLADPVRAQRIGEEGRKIAVERFSWDSLQRRLDQMIPTLL